MTILLSHLDFFALSIRILVITQVPLIKQPSPLKSDFTSFRENTTRSSTSVTIVFD